MSGYQIFNLVEGVIWWIVAIVIAFRVPRQTRQQGCAAWLGCVSFLLFGISDLLETGYEGQIPLWLWGWKCLCGVGILSSRYIWLGWNQFHWTQREFLFGLFCLAAVGVLISLQREWIVLPL